MKNNRIGSVLSSFVFGFGMIMVVFLFSKDTAEFSGKIAGIQMLNEVFIYFFAIFLFILFLTWTPALTTIRANDVLKRFVVKSIGNFQNIYEAIAGYLIGLGAILAFVDINAYIYAFLSLLIGGMLQVFAFIVPKMFPRTIQELL